jgi:hypothetical protein
LSNLKKARQSLGNDVETTNIKLPIRDKNENKRGNPFADLFATSFTKTFRIAGSRRAIWKEEYTKSAS